MDNDVHESASMDHDFYSISQNMLRIVANTKISRVMLDIQYCINTIRNVLEYLNKVAISKNYFIEKRIIAGLQKRLESCTMGLDTLGTSQVPAHGELIGSKALDEASYHEQRKILEKNNAAKKAREEKEDSRLSRRKKRENRK